MGDFTGAMADLNTAIESKKLDSEYLAKAYRFRGLAKFEKNNFDEAIEDFTTSLKYDNSYLTLYNRANAYIRLGERDKACEDYRKAAERGLSEAYEAIRKYCE
ncbi:MAG: tetratricopeptide repeat protein [Raineya sp.]|nr:tetratricopeptide repeat protein [Raineya sp.]